ncbi:hypothetical protein [Burkholderia stagnalis]|nr:hypothetical protein [Burkholderia stagnalis]
MKALLVFWAKSLVALLAVVLLAVVLVLALAQQWDEADTARVRASMLRSA